MALLRRSATLIGSLVLAIGLTAGPALAYSPSPGAQFNNPRGSFEAKNRLQVHILKAIRHAKPHSSIRIAVYSFDRHDIGAALIAAHRRGVNVQMVVNDNWTSGQTMRLRGVVGTDTTRRSFVTVCKQSCRGGAGNQHMKYFIFTRTGTAKNVLMIGSNNPTGYAARVHWNDLYTMVNKAGMAELYTKVFEQLVRDKRVPNPAITQTIGRYTSWFYPHPNTTPATDEVMKRLNKVSCKATGGTGISGHTVIRIVMYGWNGNRGRYLATKVASLRHQGCHIQALLSSAGGAVVDKLRGNGVAARSADLDLDHDDETGFDDGPFEVFTHEKWMSLNGNFAGKPGYHVWTGSENWSGLSLMNDEVTLHIPGRGNHGRYVANFNYIWNNHSRAYGTGSNSPRAMGTDVGAL